MLRQPQQISHQIITYKLLRAIGESLEPQYVAYTAVSTVIDLMKWLSATILMPNSEGDLVVRAAIGTQLTDLGINGRAFRTGDTQIVNDLMGESDMGPTYQTIYHALAVPIVRGRGPVGVFNVENDQPFTQDDVLLAESMSEVIGLALDNARLFEGVEQEHGRLRALIEADDDGIILIGRSGNVLVINAGALSMLALSGQPKEWVGRPLQKVFQNLLHLSLEASQIMQHELNRFQEGDETIGEGEISVALRAFRWRNIPVMNGMVPLGRLIILHDITEQRTLEKIRDDLTHTMVHDLRGPLTSISVSLDVLKMLEKSPEPFPEKRGQAIERAANSTKQMLFLVENILELSRLESGRMGLDYQSVNLAEVVETVLEMEMPVAKEKDVELSCEAADPLPAVWVDRDLMQRVLYNLVNNGVKFTPPHGRVHIHVQLPSSEPASLLITITDTGHGVLPEMQSQLFQKFSRGTEQARGSGLGLYFCRMVVEAHHGRIWLDHSDQTGSTFCLTLPLAV